MKKLFYAALACGVLGMLQVPLLRAQQSDGSADQPATAPEAQPSQTAVPPAQVQVVPGTAEALVVQIRTGLAGAIPGPVTDGTLGAPGMGTRVVNGAAMARSRASPYVGRFTGFGPYAAGSFLSTPLGPGTFGISEATWNALQASGAVAYQEVPVPIITNIGGEATLTLGSAVIPVRPPSTTAGINAGFGARAINTGFGTPAINMGFGTQSFNTGFGPHSINVGFRNGPGY